jgi:radical SAM protein with 4Fe4S-binding SPASM domain
MGEYVKIAELMFDKFQATPELLNKITIEYRPFRKNPTLEQTDFSEAITPEQKKETAKEIIKMTNVKPEIIPFLKAQTNITTFTIGNEHTKYDFNKCYFSQVSNIIRPNGEIRPCFMRIEEPEFIIGNILHDPLEKIALNSLYVAAIKAKNCDAQGCRLCYLNHLVQENIGLNPTEIPIEIKRENMF